MGRGVVLGTDLFLQWISSLLKYRFLKVVWHALYVMIEKSNVYFYDAVICFVNIALTRILKIVAENVLHVANVLILRMLEMFGFNNKAIIYLISWSNAF